MKRICVLLLMIISTVVLAEPVTLELEAFSVFKDMNGGSFGAFSVLEIATTCARCGTSDYALEIPWYKDADASWTSEDLTDPINDATYVGFWVNFQSGGADPNSEDCAFAFLQVGPSDGIWDIALKIEDTGTCNSTNHKLCVYDANDSLVACTLDDPFLDNEWYWLDLVFNQSDTQGWVSFWYTIDDGSRSVGATILENLNDFKTVTTGARQIRLRSQTAVTGGSVQFWVRGLIIQEGMDLIGSNMPPWGVYTTEINPYKNSTTPDCDEVGDTSSLDTLSAGNWDDIGDGVLATKASYADGNGGAIAADDNTLHGLLGPFTTDTWVNPVYGCRFGWRALGAGPGGDNHLIWGKFDGTTYTVSKQEPPGCGRLCDWSKQLLPDDANFPNADEYAVMGFYNAQALFTAVSLQETRCWYFSAYPKSEPGVWDRPNAGTVARGTNRGGG